MKTYYFVFEIQGYEQLVVKATGETEQEAYYKALETYALDGGRLDVYTVEPKNLWRYDCCIVDEDGEEIAGEVEIPEDDEEEGGNSDDEDD